MDKKYDLVCFDLDGTLIANEGHGNIWTLVISTVPGLDKVEGERYKLFLEEKLSYKEWARIDLEDWKKHGITKKIVEEKIRQLSLSPGADKLLATLKDSGYKLAVISGSISPVIDILFPNHPFDDIFITEVFFDEKGQVKDYRISEYAENGSKSNALKKICERENIPLERTVFIGDHLNDIGACKIAGLGIAYNSSMQRLIDACDHSIDGDMMQILDLIEKND